MKCFSCPRLLPRDSITDTCDVCLLSYDEDDYSYDDEVRSEIQGIVNPTGLTPARFFE